MGLFTRLVAPARGFRFLRRLLVEARGIRRALERQADALELAQRASGDAGATRAQTFRNYARVKADLADRDLKDLTSVEYVDADLLARALAAEVELKALLGRDPSEAELWRALDGREA